MIEFGDGIILIGAFCIHYGIYDTLFELLPRVTLILHQRCCGVTFGFLSFYIEFCILDIT